MTRYADASALRQAIETRLKQTSDDNGTDLGRLRRMFVFDRLLSRLALAPRGQWILKGGAALEFRLSSRALYGNVASALADASAMLAGSCPARAEAAHRLTTQILTLEPLRGTGEFGRSGPGGPRLQFVRHSCCLPYRVPGAGTRGDCVLTASR